MNPEQLHAQREMDQEILHYVRGMQNVAPVTEESVTGYLKHVRRRKVLDAQVCDRIGYLVEKGWLKRDHEFVSGAGYEDFYLITADGRDVLDGAIPME